MLSSPLLKRKTYVNGWHRPAVRGVLHGLGAVVLLFLFVGYSCATLCGLLPKIWLRFTALLGAKLLSYFCSAVLHLYPHPSVESFNFWLRMDLIGICFAVWAPTAVFLEDAPWFKMKLVPCWFDPRWRRYRAMPWHFSGFNGWHEDFHLVVALADLAFCMMAYDAGTEARSLERSIDKKRWKSNEFE
eukprot:Skav226975  [mRNA]  locus=scaffold927:25919:30909:- [translate_table: standard]